MARLGRSWLGLTRPTGPIRYVMSLAEQGFASALNLGANLWLIRHLDPAAYGMFVLASNAALILCNVQGGMTIAHLLALAPSQPDRERPERMILAVTLLSVAGSAVIGAVIVTLSDWTRAVLPAALAAYLPALMLFSYTRALAFSRGLVMASMAQSGTVLLIAALLLAAATSVGAIPRADLALLILACAYAATATVMLLRLCGGLLSQLRWRDLLHFRAYARESLWVLVGIAAVELLGRFNSIIVSVWFDTAAVGTIGATMLLLRPIGMAVSAWSLIGRVGMVERREARDWAGFVRRVLQNVAGSIAISVPWVAGVYFAWPFISAHLFGGRYAGDAWIVLLSGLSTIVSVIQFMLSVGFQSLRRFRLIAYTDIAGAAVAIAATLLLLALRFGFAMSLVGMTAGQLLDAGLLGVMLYRMARRA